MGDLIGGIIKAALVGVLFYLSWNFLNSWGDKEKKIANSHKTVYKVIKVFLYMILALMILLFILFFLIGAKVIK